MSDEPVAHALSGLRMLVPRAPDRGDGLRLQIEALGGEARCVPALDIVPITNASAVQQQLGETGDLDAAVFTSVNAVTYWFALTGVPRLPRTVFGVGSATVDALGQHGVAARAPQRQDSEGLLAESELLGASSVLLLTGEGGRGALRERLDQTTRLIVIELYRRRPGAALPARLTSIADWVNVVLAPSAETYAALIQCDAQIGRRLLGCPVVAPSERVIQHIRTLGSNAPAWLAAPFGDAAVLEALRAHWVQPPNQCARDDD